MCVYQILIEFSVNFSFLCKINFLRNIVTFVQFPRIPAPYCISNRASVKHDSEAAGDPRNTKQ